MKEQEAIGGIAIIGMAGRFPGAMNIDEFWGNLENGVESIRPLSDEVLLAAGEDPALLKDPGYIKAAGLVDDVDLFDASFFGMNPLEAEILDPQHRCFLECSWEALENACYTPDACDGRIGVYAGIGANHYQAFNLRSNRFIQKTAGQLSITVANEKDYLATRCSYTLNLKGPSLTVQTACSTSLVAVCLACQSLLTYQTDMALAGGVFFRLRKRGARYQEGSIISPDGHTRSFDSKAKGTMFTSGLGIVVLKRLDDALADGDHIYAFIKGFAVNNDGSVKVGFTAPGVNGQSEVIAEALAMADVNPETIGLVEAHGTATQLGDPIEIAALTKAYRMATQRIGFCAIGSVKSNIGHTNAAAGVAGLIKTSLALKHRKMPPSLHFHEPNPHIDFANSPFFVNTRLSEWGAGGTPRRAAVSSFGIGGTNAHVILEEAPEQKKPSESRPHQLIVLSARTSTALERATTNLVDYLKRDQNLCLPDVAFCLQAGRKAFEHRRMLVCRDREDAIAALVDMHPKRVLTSSPKSGIRPVVFMFSGQGSQYVNMGLELYRRETTFRQEIDLCSELLEPSLHLDLREILYPGDEQRIKEETRRLDQTSITQPALFAIEYALAKLWMEWGIQPEAMIGHSIGEYVAACLAGVFSLEDALALVSVRGRLMQEMAPGTMLALQMSEAQIQPLLGNNLSLASVNAPLLSVVSGPTEDIHELETQLARNGIVGRRLQTSHAFHSAMMDAVLGSFIEVVKGVRRNAPLIPYVSNLTGTWVTEAQATDPAYWANHLRRTVRFSDGVLRLLEDQERVFLEVGPGRTLQTLVKQSVANASDQLVVEASLRHPHEQSSDTEFILSTLGKLWLSGVQADWSGFYKHEQRRRMILPTYPFERERYWIEPTDKQPDPVSRPATVSKKLEIGEWFYIPVWTRSAPPGLLDHEEVEDKKPSWLIFLDEHGLGSQIARSLQQHDMVVKHVIVGNEFSRVDDDTYAVNPKQREDFTSLIQELQRGGKIPNRILHLWSLAPNSQNCFNAQNIEKMKDLGFYSLVFLAQALGNQLGTESIKMTAVCNGTQEVTGQETLCPEKGIILGPCRVIPHEYPQIRCSLVDVDLPESQGQSHQLVEYLIHECSLKSPASMVAYRGNHRWIQSFEPVRLDGKLKEAQSFREGGTYLITGGLGGIGLVLAEHMGRTPGIKLVLVGRSPFPDRDKWQDWLDTHPETDDVSCKIRKVKSIERCGAQTMVFSADVAQQEQMQEVIDQVYKTWGTVHGVIHAAGVPAGGLIQLKTPAMVESVFAPKVKGTLVLESLFRHKNLDFFIVFSSIVSILGNVGQVDYCGANAFLDAFAHWNTRKNNQPSMSINWDQWEEVGMAVKAREIWPMAPAASTRQETDQGLPDCQEIDHLLFNKRRLSADQDTYLAELSPSKHWVLDEHRLLGTPTLVGTAYLEMARAAFERHAVGKTIEMRDVFFLSPLTVKDGEQRQVQAVIQKNNDVWKFSIQSRSQLKDDGGSEWGEHAVGKILCAESESPQIHDINGILDRCNLREVTHLGYETPEGHKSPETRSSSVISFGPRWENLKYRLNIGANEGLASLELPDEFCHDLDKCQLHPALMDVAISLTAVRTALREGDSGMYLPFSYGKLKIKGPLSRKIYSHVQHKGGDTAKGQFIVADVAIMDESGVELVKVEGFTMKRVSLGAFKAQTKKADQSLGTSSEDAKPKVPAGPAVPATDAGIIGIVPEEGVEAFRRILGSINGLPQIIVSTRDLQARIAKVKAISKTQILAKLEKAPSAKRDKHSRPSMGTPFVAPRNQMEQTVADVWGTLLGIEKVGIHDDFQELGGNSLVGVQIVSRIREAFQIELPIEVFLKAPTVAETAEAIAQALIERADQEALAQMLSEIEQMPVKQ